MWRAIVYICAVGFVAPTVVGCASAPPSRTAWIAGHGGLVNGALQARADAALAHLMPAIQGRPSVCVRVLGSESVGAFSWPDGTLFVHRRLIEALSDDELSAALAHELGHLLNDGHLRGVASLRGCCRDLDNEARADARGVEVLRTSGIDPEAMAAMLSKLTNLLPDAPICRREIGRRIGLLAAPPR